MRAALPGSIRSGPHCASGESASMVDACAGGTSTHPVVTAAIAQHRDRFDHLPGAAAYHVSRRRLRGATKMAVPVGVPDLLAEPVQNRHQPAGEQCGQMGVAALYGDMARGVAHRAEA